MPYSPLALAAGVAALAGRWRFDAHFEHRAVGHRSAIQGHDGGLCVLRVDIVDEAEALASAPIVFHRVATPGGHRAEGGEDLIEVFSGRIRRQATNEEGARAFIAAPFATRQHPCCDKALLQFPDA